MGRRNTCAKSIGWSPKAQGFSGSHARSGSGAASCASQSPSWAQMSGLGHKRPWKCAVVPPPAELNSTPSWVIEATYQFRESDSPTIMRSADLPPVQPHYLIMRSSCDAAYCLTLAMLFIGPALLFVYC